MAGKQGSAFVTARKGFCYLTIKVGRRNFDMTRIRKYALDADEKRHMRRLYRKRSGGATFPVLY